MARIRSIKPEFFTSEDIKALPLRARLTFIGLWTFADDYGNAKAVHALIKAAVWPLDDEITAEHVAEDLGLLEAGGQIRFYEVDGRSYLSILAWSQHQKVDRPSAAKRYPAPQIEQISEARESASRARENVPGDREGDREQGTGRGSAAEAAQPSPFCSKHPGGTTEPCRACGDARMTYKAAEVTESLKPTPIAPRADLTPMCSKHEGYPDTRIMPCAACIRERQAVA